MASSTRKFPSTILCVVAGVLWLLSAAGVGLCADETQIDVEVHGAWRWLDDAEYARDAAIADAQASSLFVPTHRDFAPDSLFLQSTFPLSATDFIAPEEESDERVEYIYRGANLSSLAIAPFRKRVFAYAGGAWGVQDVQEPENDRPGFKAGSWGGGVGQDWNLFGHGIVGYGLQGNETKIRPSSGGVYRSSLSTFAGYLHMSVFDALWRVDATFGMARNWQKQRLLANDALSSFVTSQWLLDLEFGARIDRGYTRIEPIINMRILNLHEPAKAERLLTSKSYATEFSDASYRLKIGSRFSWEHETVLATLKPYLLATWSHEFGKREIYTLGDNTPFPVAMRFGEHRMARDKLDLGGGVDAAMRETLDLYFQYDVEFAKEYIDYLFFAGLNKKF